MFDSIILTILNVSISSMLILIPAVLIAGMKKRLLAHFRKTTMFVSLLSLAVMFCVSLSMQYIHVPVLKPVISLPQGGAASRVIAQSASVLSPAADPSGKSCSTAAEFPVKAAGASGPDWG